MTKNRDGLVRLIGVFKLAKAALLIALGVGGIVSMPREVAAFAQRTLASIGLFPGHDQAQRAIDKLRHLDEATATKFGVLSLGYAALFLVEGLGLLFRKRWAEWMTVAVTASFIPIEIYELVKRATVGMVVALLLNIAILVYLVYRRVEDRRRFAARLVRAIGAA